VEKMSHQHEIELHHEKLVFFTNITHEFRTPLTLILGPIEDLLGEKDIKYAFKKKLLLIYRNSNRLNDLINKVLDFRKVETGLMKIKISYGNMLQTIKETCFPFREIFQEKNIMFCLEHEQDELNVWYDPDKINIILNNLLSNAYKYTQAEGKVVVSVSQKNNLGNGNLVVLKVSDTGSGISEDELPIIFDRYYRIGKQNNTSGSGIGLALTKSLVDLHKGKITVDSVVNQGTTFHVELPVSKDIYLPGDIVEQPFHSLNYNGSKHVFPIEKEEEQLTEDYEKLNNKEILLIIEDNLEILEYIKDSFHDSFKVLSAIDGEEGLALAFKYIPDIIITDVMMPKVDGLEVCRRLKKNIKTCHIPVVMLTARNTLMQKQEGYEVGADSYVTKPFSFTLLKSRVKNLMQSRKMLTEHISRSMLIQPDETKINLKDEQFISNAITIIEKNMIAENFSVDVLSAELGLSHSVLYRKIKALSGYSISRFIRSIRLKNAAQLLRTKQYTISEVAFQVGFNDMKYFRQAFKEQYKVLPSEYQKQ
jgi:DNA-binding response OmpR family regulator/anti-sigma regulatory factor (Ser/Thr protein kinase)